LRFVLVDKILELQASKHILASKQVAQNEDYFADHFPGYPVVPGVLLVEMIAQTAGKCLMAGMDKSLWPVLLQIRQANFRKTVLPGSSLLIEAFIESSTRSTATATGIIRCEDQTVTEASFLFGFIPRIFLKEGFEDEVLRDYMDSQA